MVPSLVVVLVEEDTAAVEARHLAAEAPLREEDTRPYCTAPAVDWRDLLQGAAGIDSNTGSTRPRALGEDRQAVETACREQDRTVPRRSHALGRFHVLFDVH
jgi:hypothetical protein